MSYTLRPFPTHMLHEGFLHRQVASLVASGIEVEQTIKTYTLHACSKSALRRIRLQAAARPNPHKLQLAQLRFHRARFKVNIGQRVQFV